MTVLLYDKKTKKRVLRRKLCDKEDKIEKIAKANATSQYKTSASKLRGPNSKKT